MSVILLVLRYATAQLGTDYSTQSCRPGLELGCRRLAEDDHRSTAMPRILCGWDDHPSPVAFRNDVPSTSRPSSSAPLAFALFARGGYSLAPGQAHRAFWMTRQGHAHVDMLHRAWVGDVLDAVHCWGRPGSTWRGTVDRTTLVSRRLFLFLSASPGIIHLL